MYILLFLYTLYSIKGVDGNVFFILLSVTLVIILEEHHCTHLNDERIEKIHKSFIALCKQR